jgi:hypothetical protein
LTEPPGHRPQSPGHRPKSPGLLPEILGVPHPPLASPASYAEKRRFSYTDSESSDTRILVSAA